MNGYTITALLVAALATILWRRAVRALRYERFDRRLERLGVARRERRMQMRIDNEVASHTRTQRALDKARLGVKP